MISKFAWNRTENDDDNEMDSKWNEAVTTEEVFCCIKILKKIRSKPSILNTPLFNPIHCALKQLVDVAMAAPEDLVSSLSKTARIAKRAQKKTDDDRMKMRCGIRIARQQRADQSLKFRQLLERQQLQIEGTETAAIEAPKEEIEDIEIDENEQILQNQQINEHQNGSKMDIDSERTDSAVIAEPANPSNTVLQIEETSHLTPCDPQEVDEVIRYLSGNHNVAQTTPFQRGTVIRDFDGRLRLDLCHQHLGPQNVRRITEAMAQNLENSKISALLVGSNFIGDLGAKAVADLIASNGTNPRNTACSLSTIFLEHNGITAEGIKALTRSLTENKKVRGLHLGHNPIGIEGAKYIGALLARNCTLRTLDVMDTQIGKEGVKHIAEGLISNAQRSGLQRLSIGQLTRCSPQNRRNRSGTLLSASFVEQTFCAMLTQCVGLKEVFLGSANLGNVGATELGKALLTAPQLEVLSLTSCLIEDDGAIAISWSMSSHSMLKYLDFGWNRITDRGAMGIAQALSVMDGGQSQFERLSLEYNQIGDIGARSLLSVLQQMEKAGNHHIVRLDVAGNVDMERKDILKSIGRLCAANLEWKRLHREVADSDLSDNGDVVMDTVMDQMDGQNGQNENNGNSVSDEVRAQRIMEQGINVKRGEIRKDLVIGTVCTLSAAERDTLATRSVYGHSESDGMDQNMKSIGSAEWKRVNGVNEERKSDIKQEDEVTISITANFENRNNPRSRRRSKKAQKHKERKEKRGKLLRFVMST